MLDKFRFTFDDMKGYLLWGLTLGFSAGVLAGYLFKTFEPLVD